MKVMVLGGGNCQINLIERLKRSGDEVILIDYLTDCVASTVCDNHIVASTFDIPAVLRAAKENNIEAIVTLGTDQPIYTAAVTAFEMGLPFYLTPKQALFATNKRVMKKIFTENGIPTVQYVLIGKGFSDEEIRKIPFPAVMKPVDSQGQRGIYKVESIDEIRKYMDDTLSFSREDKVLLESYYESDEITVNGWLNDGRLTILSVVDRVTLTSGNHIGICIAHNFPSVHLKANYEEIETITRNITKTFGFVNGPVYFQYLIGAQGIKVNEIAMRIGGAYEDITLPDITGIDVLDTLIKTVKGQTVDLSMMNNYNLDENEVFLSTQMFFLQPGKIKRISINTNKLRESGTYNVRISRKEGDTVGGIENATARAGYFLTKANGYKQLAQRIDEAYEIIKILDDRGQNMVLRYNSYPNKYKFAPQMNVL